MKSIHLLTCLIVILFAGCKPSDNTRTAPENTVYVKTISVRSINYTIPVRVTGLLGTRKEMKLSFKTGGIVKKVAVRDGDRVNKGQLLLSLDLVEIDAQVKQAVIALQKAERDLERVRNLYVDSVATLEQLQNAKSAWELARAQKQIAEFNLSHSKIEAPVKGKVQKVLVEENELIAPGYPAVLFASTEDNWVVRVAVTDKDIVRLSPRDPALLTMDAFPGDTIAASVSELAAIADPVTGTYEAELRIGDPDPRFRTGFITRAMIYPKDRKSGIRVPMEALLNASDRNAYVYLLRRGKPEKIRVKTGPVTGAYLIVTEGLAEGDTLITSGAPYIGSDSKLIVTP